MKKALLAPEVRALDPANLPGKDRCGRIFVRPLKDRRTPGEPTHHGHWALNLNAVLAEAPGEIFFHRDLISGLFRLALSQAGYDAVMDPTANSRVSRLPAGCIVLEGQVWSFQFETRAVPSLELDLSLQLRASGRAEVLWQSDFPEDSSVPFWIGLGCDPRDMARAAMQEVVDAARRQFATPEFRESARQRTPPAPEPESGATMEDSHAVVGSSSWTGTDEGEIRATAHVSGSPQTKESVPVREPHGADLRSLPGKSPQPVKA